MVRQCLPHRIDFQHYAIAGDRWLEDLPTGRSRVGSTARTRPGAGTEQLAIKFSCTDAVDVDDLALNTPAAISVIYAFKFRASSSSADRYPDSLGVGVPDMD